MRLSDFVFEQQWVVLVATFIFLRQIWLFLFEDENLLDILTFLTILIDEGELYFVRSSMQS